MGLSLVRIPLLGYSGGAYGATYAKALAPLNVI